MGTKFEAKKILIKLKFFTETVLESSLELDVEIGNYGCRSIISKRTISYWSIINTGKKSKYA